MKEKKQESLYLNPFLLSPQKLAEFVEKNQGQIIGQTLVDWHNFAIVSKKISWPRQLVFQKKERDRDDRLKLINSLIEDGWKCVYLWGMGAVKLEICAKRGAHEINFEMTEQESMSSSLVEVFTPFMMEFSRLLVPQLGKGVELNFQFSKIEDSHQAYLIKPVPKRHWK